MKLSLKLIVNKLFSKKKKNQLGFVSDERKIREKNDLKGCTPFTNGHVGYTTLLHFIVLIQLRFMTLP